MKEQPILFSAPMVRAIITGMKTQTRRVVKPQPIEFGGEIVHPGAIMLAAIFGHDVSAEEIKEIKPECPFGVPGDRLWVRESARVASVTTGHKPWYTVEYKAGGPDLVRYEKMPGRWFPRKAHNVQGDRLWCPAIHTPRWASRLTLEIVSVRVERLVGISDADAQAEGITYEHAIEFADDGSPDYVLAFRELWESVSGKGSWEADPWVWVVEFEVVKPETAGGS